MVEDFKNIDKSLHNRLKLTATESQMRQRVFTAATSPLEGFSFASRKQRRAISTLRAATKPVTPLELKGPKNPFFSRIPGAATTAAAGSGRAFPALTALEGLNKPGTSIQSTLETPHFQMGSNRRPAVKKSLFDTSIVYDSMNVKVQDYDEHSLMMDSHGPFHKTTAF